MSPLDNTKKFIELKQQRSFGDLIGLPFTFLFQEFKGLILAILRYAGPIFALAILLGVVLLRDAFNSLPLQNAYYSPLNLSASILLVYIVFLIAIYTITATVFNYIAVYEKMGKGNFTVKDVGNGLMTLFFKILGGGLLLGIFTIPVVIILFLIPIIGPFLFFILITFISVNLSLFPFILAYEKIGVWAAFTRSFELIKQNWWFSFGLYIVFIIIIYVSIYAAMIPLILVGTLSAVAGFSTQGGLVVMIALFAVLIFFIYILLISTINILFGFQYFNLLVRKESPTLADRISAINNDETQLNDTVEKETNKEGESKKEIHSENKITQKDDDFRIKPII